eukprot:CAMPEP_0174290272 /NCGR_PEP_ID=MMETSP0809-20121228/28153_1 /TAXON_ID=73025 ORGANISM="Eutreptiella gymnastica-like, Strain CCMP1594" /NCGR_SAMPLE_ID=MMETSP0809 /ASSEMBLY_ACC=CAM_ASM_000658 /LENGTH=751 /DNA_ID=CAMNT_0015388809 /DNA_START=96 /DNA_END=2351 /DNA_ORIENTATION=+
MTMLNPQFNNLPKLPGMGFGEELLRTDFRKSQLLNSKTGVQDKRVKPDVQPFDTLRLANTQLGGNTQAKMSLDRKVLRFQAFFKEGVHESPQEQERVRRCIVYYFLEDDTISVSEPKQDNSGIAGQGALIKRHQIPRPDGGAYSFEDFNIGREVMFYGKCFHLIDCDTFTRKFLLGLGVDVPEPEDQPQDQYTEIRRKVTAQMVPRKQKTGNDMDYHQGGSGRQAKLTPEEIGLTKQFLAHDKKVLRFYCQWDDRDSLYGDVRLYILHYFLSNDTIEIAETNPPNCGRDPFPSFVKRSKVPKQRDGQFVNPNASLSFKTETVEYFTDADLRIGNYLRIFGRTFLIYDCDEFTKNFLGSKYGITDFTPVDISQPGPPKIPVEPPPYNGFGDEEDSLGSWKYLVLKAPKKDIKKFMEHANNQLKFQLKLKGGDPSNAIRKFVLTYFLSDDTVSIFEPAQRNSGIIGGKFLQRQKVKKVGSDGLPTGEYIQPQDLYVGATVIINTHTFVVYSTDERSLTFMEYNAHQFPKSNIDIVLSNLRSMLVSRQTGLQHAFAAADSSGNGYLDYEEFAAIIERLQLPIAEQEILTLMRHFDRNSDGQISWTEFMDTVLPREVQSQYESKRDQAWEEIRAMAEQQTQDELDRFNSDMNGTVTQLNAFTDQAMRNFLEKWNQRRSLFMDVFRTVADHSPDGNIGEAEFRKAVQAKLKLGLTEKALKAVCYKLFPENLKRIPLLEFQRILNGTSTYVHLKPRR